MLHAFFHSHRCTPSFSRQYRAAVFYRNEAQREQAIAAKAEAEKALGIPLTADIVPVVHFTVAEDYHQKYYLRENPALMRDFRRLCTSDEDFRESTAAARVNAALGGQASRASLQPVLESLGLSSTGLADLLSGIR